MRSPRLRFPILISKLWPSDVKWLGPPWPPTSLHPGRFQVAQATSHGDRRIKHRGPRSHLVGGVPGRMSWRTVTPGTPAIVDEERFVARRTWQRSAESASKKCRRRACNRRASSAPEWSAKPHKSTNPNSKIGHGFKQHVRGQAHQERNEELERTTDRWTGRGPRYYTWGAMRLGIVDRSIRQAVHSPWHVASLSNPTRNPRRSGTA